MSRTDHAVYGTVLQPVAQPPVHITVPSTRDEVSQAYSFRERVHVVRVYVTHPFTVIYAIAVVSLSFFAPPRIAYGASAGRNIQGSAGHRRREAIHTLPIALGSGDRRPR